MHKGIIAYIAIIIIIIVVAYVTTGGFKFLSPKIVTVTIRKGTSTATTTIQPTTTANYNGSVLPCGSFSIVGQAFNTVYTEKCNSTGITYGLWVAAGNSGLEHVKIVGADKKVYINQSSNYNCTTFFTNFTLPVQLYTITFTTGAGGGSCGNAEVIINTTTTPPKTLYNYILNGNFGNGQYTGWNAANPGFGTAPFNITHADSVNVSCYVGQPWSNYNGTYFATTYNCGVSVSPGNLTSTPFLVGPSKPFLNFRLISPENNQLYLQLLRVNYKIQNGQQVFSNFTPVVIAHFDTYNLSINLNGSSTFENVSIPLTQFIGQPLAIRVISKVVGSDYIAAGDFALANRPVQQKGVLVNVTYTGK